MFGIGLPELIILGAIFVIFILPFIINVRLAKNRGKSVTIILACTLLFSWIVTFVLLFFPKVEDTASMAVEDN
jgi:hypothetical protein